MDKQLETEIKPGLYRHFKGGEYKVLYVAKHTETEEALVIYQALYGERGVWARPKSLFLKTAIYNDQKVQRFKFIE